MELHQLIESGEAERVEELDLSEQAFDSFPEELLSFPSLHTLTMSRIAFAIPEEAARLSSLRALHLTFCPSIPEGLGRLRSLRALSVRHVESQMGASPVGLPEELAGLSELERLDLTGTVLSDEIGVLAALASLRELVLDNALGAVSELPELGTLPRLEVLHCNGNGGWAGLTPDPEILARVWEIGSLVELHIDRWLGEEGGARRFPDRAFARMRGLRKLDLSFNAIESVPESLYDLSELEFMNLRYTKVSEQTVARLREVFPQTKTRIVLRNTPASDDYGHPRSQQAQQLFAQGQSLLQSDPLGAVERFEGALAIGDESGHIPEAVELGSLYCVAYALGSVMEGHAGPRRATYGERFVEAAERALAMVPSPAMVWTYTPLGKMQKEVARFCGNALAQHYSIVGTQERGLAPVERALSFREGAEHDFIYGTKVRLLLALGREERAWEIVRMVTRKNLTFRDFDDLIGDERYLAWLDA